MSGLQKWTECLMNLQSDERLDRVNLSSIKEEVRKDVLFPVAAFMLTKDDIAPIGKCSWDHLLPLLVQRDFVKNYFLLEHKNVERPTIFFRIKYNKKYYYLGMQLSQKVCTENDYHGIDVWHDFKEAKTEIENERAKQKIRLKLLDAQKRLLLSDNLEDMSPLIRKGGYDFKEIKEELKENLKVKN